uniref:Uncharacterized protein n=1 Tax=Glossina palpalis gambiensis TaxID=67801 RepID=A0A1B0BK51_9MUSC
MKTTLKKILRLRKSPQLGKFLKNAVETDTQCIIRKLPLQEMEKDTDTTSLKNNSPVSIATLSDSTCCNVRTNSINKLTPKEPMDCLNIYGEAPPINLLPVLMGSVGKYDKIKEMIQDPKDGQEIVRIIVSRGNNLHEVETADRETEYFQGKWNKF